MPRDVLGRHGLHEVRQRPGDGPGIGHHPERHREVAPDGERVNVHLDDLRGRGDIGVAVEGGVEPEPRAERQDAIRLPRQPARHRVAAWANATGVQGMIHRRDVTMAGRGRDRQLQRLGEFEQVGRAAPPLDAGPGMDHRGARCQQQRLDVLQRGAIDRAARHHRLAARRGERDVDLVVEQVTRDVDHHRPPAPGVGDPERFEDELGDALRAWHAEGALGHRLKQDVLVNLLERVAPEVLGGRQPGDDHHRRIRQLRLSQPQDHVGRARARLPTDEDPWRLRDAPIGVGHVHATVFVPHADVGEVCGVVERIVDFKRARAHQPEDRCHPDSAQRFHGCDTAPHFGHGYFPSACAHHPGRTLLRLTAPGCPPRPSFPVSIGHRDSRRRYVPGCAGLP